MAAINRILFISETIIRSVELGYKRFEEIGEEGGAVHKKELHFDFE